MEIPEVKKALAERAEAVCRHLLPGGKLSKNEWLCGNLSGSAGESLKIVVHGAKAGLWKDFAGDSSSNNLLELWVQARGVPFQDALREAKEWLGHAGARVESHMKPAQPRQYAKPSLKGITRLANAAEMYLTAERMLPQEIVELYKISMTDDGNAVVFPYLHHEAPHKAQMIKYIKLERNEAGKKECWNSVNTPKVLFGKHTRRPTDRYLLISEGEIDGMTWRSRNLPDLCCTSVPFGAKWEGKDGRDPNDEWIENDWEFLHSFERIYLSFDMDEAGQKAAASIIKRMGREICYVIKLPLKDSNDTLRAGRGAELDKAFVEARTMDPAALKNASVFADQVLERMYSTNPDERRGIKLPFGNYPFHLRWNEWSVITGINGSGKTQCLNFLLLHLWKLGFPSCIASLEVPVVQTLEFQLRQTLGAKNPERPRAEAGLKWLAGGLWFYDHVGRASAEDILATFRYAYRRHGVRFFVIDSWMKLGIDPEDLKAQGEICTALSDFVKDHDVHVFVVAHPRKQKDEDSAPGKMDIKGSGELTDQAHNVLVMWRNKKKEKEIEQLEKFKASESDIVAKRRTHPDAKLTVEKQRNDDGENPTIDLWYHKESKQYFGHYRDSSICFLDENMKMDLPADPEPPAEAPDDDVPF